MVRYKQAEIKAKSGKAEVKAKGGKALPNYGKIQRMKEKPGMTRLCLTMVRYKQAEIKTKGGKAVSNYGKIQTGWNIAKGGKFCDKRQVEKFCYWSFLDVSICIPRHQNCIWYSIYTLLLMMCIVDSVEEGEKLVQTALENFGRIGQYTHSWYMYVVVSQCILVQFHISQ